MIRSVLVLACMPFIPLAPQEGQRMFDMELITVDREAARQLAPKLVAYAQSQAAASPEYHFVGSYRHLVRLAFQLAPDEPIVAAAHERIRSGKPPEEPKRAVEGKEFLPYLVALLTKARDGSSKDDQSLAGYLGSAGLMVDPSNQACLAEFDRQVRNTDTFWEPAMAAYRRSIADGAVSTVNGLVVTSAGSAQAGQVARIVLTFRSSRNVGIGMRVGESLEVRLLREKGVEMNVAAEESVRYWNRIRKHSQLPSGTAEISFEDKFTRKDPRPAPPAPCC
ncbi:MAG TPA: hypothetical protein VJU16_03265 [Planctomycetota bacterium]|nr:hypothetical protein [Planctomycetota bacterium]